MYYYIFFSCCAPLCIHIFPRTFYAGSARNAQIRNKNSPATMIVHPCARTPRFAPKHAGFIKVRRPRVRRRRRHNRRLSASCMHFIRPGTTHTHTHNTTANTAAAANEQQTSTNRDFMENNDSTLSLVCNHIFAGRKRRRYTKKGCNILGVPCRAFASADHASVCINNPHITSSERPRVSREKKHALGLINVFIKVVIDAWLRASHVHASSIWCMMGLI